MTNEIVEKYFDNLASDWDSFQDCPEDVKRALLKSSGIYSGARVLDVACGTGAITKILHDLTGEPVKGVDLSGEMIKVAQRKFEGCDWAEFEHVDFLDMNEDEAKNKQGETFDFVVIYNAYPHFLDVDALCHKAHEVLKEGGKLVIAHSISREMLNSHHKQHADHVSRPLGSPFDEAKHFEKYFDVQIAEESNKHYLLVLKTV